MVRKTTSQATSVVEQTRREAWSSERHAFEPRYSFKVFFFYKFFYNLKFKIN